MMSFKSRRLSGQRLVYADSCWKYSCAENFIYFRDRKLAFLQHSTNMCNALGCINISFQILMFNDLSYYLKKNPEVK